MPIGSMIRFWRPTDSGGEYERVMRDDDEGG